MLLRIARALVPKTGTGSHMDQTYIRNFWVRAPNRQRSEGSSSLVLRALRPRLLPPSLSAHLHGGGQALVQGSEAALHTHTTNTLAHKHTSTEAH